jgi:hypothetical protein
VPPQKGRWLDDGESAPPRRKQRCRSQQSKSILRRQPGMRGLSPQDDDLVPEHPVFEDELPPCPSQIHYCARSDVGLNMRAKKTPGTTRQRSKAIDDLPGQSHTPVRALPRRPIKTERKRFRWERFCRDQRRNRLTRGSRIGTTVWSPCRRGTEAPHHGPNGGTGSWS